MNKEEIKSIGIMTADIYLHFPYITEDECDDLDEFLEDNHIEYEGATDTFIDLQQENKQLKVQLLEKRCSDKDIEYKKRLKIENNWNKLKEYIKETKLKEFEKSYGKRYGKTFTQAEIIVCNMILDKMLELEGSDYNGNN